MNIRKAIAIGALSLGIFSIVNINTYAEEANVTNIDELSHEMIEQLLEENRIEIEKIEKEKAEAATKSEHTVQESVAGTNSELAQKIIDTAKTHLGKPYSYGANGPYAFDCSGFTKYVMAQCGINIPRTSGGQAYGGKIQVSKANLVAGDLVIFNTYGSLSHAGIYIGDGMFIHASSSRSGGVIISNINDSYYGPRFATGARYI